MKKIMISIALIASTVAIGCAKKDSGSGGTSTTTTTPYFNNTCNGFQPQTSSPYRIAQNGTCIDTRNGGRPAPQQNCQYDTRLTGWSNNGANGTFNPNCGFANNNQYSLNYFHPDVCSQFAPEFGTVYRPVVYPRSGQTVCVRETIISNYIYYNETSYRYREPRYMRNFPGAYIGCVPGGYVPRGCNCVGYGPNMGMSAGVGVGAGFYVSPWGIGFGAGLYAGFGVGAGYGMQPAGICYN